MPERQEIFSGSSPEMSNLDAAAKLAQQCLTLTIKGIKNLTFFIGKYPILSLSVGLLAAAYASENFPLTPENSAYLGIELVLTSAIIIFGGLSCEAILRDRQGITPKTTYHAIRNKWQAFRRGEMKLRGLKPSASCNGKD